MGEWTSRRIGDFATRIRRLNNAGLDLPPFSVTKDRGVVLQSEKYHKRIATDPHKYLIAHPGEFVYDAMSLYYGSIGQVLHQAPGLVSPDYVLFAVDDSIDHGFLQHVLRSNVLHRTYETLAEGGNQHGKRRRIYWPVFESITIRVPPRDEQRRIASVLSAAEARVVGEGSCLEGLRVVSAALRQHFVDDADATAPLGSLLAEPIRNGYSPEAPRTPTGRWSLHLGAVSADGYVAGAVKPAPLGDPRVEQSLLRKGDVVVSRSNTRARVGLAGVFVGDVQDCAYPDLLMRVRCGARILPEYLECVLLAPKARHYFGRNARGTSESMVKIDRQILEAFEVPLPGIERQRRIVEVMSGVRALVTAQARVVAEAAALRRALIRDLLGGVHT